ncbi:MAG: transglycosylase domain-containing protein [Chloroflexi bacterium]|nr:transglycosylase domain-containing protein [Chloroflexota bacterium]
MTRFRRDLMIHRRLHHREPPKPSVLWLLALVLSLSFALGGCATLLASGAGTAHANNSISRDLPAPDSLVTQPLGQVTQIYDRTGQHLLYEFYEQRRIVVPLSDVAPVMIDATLAAEDVSYYDHRGFDLRGMARAAWVNFTTGQTVQGGSMISQQLVKRMLLTPEKS